MNYFQTSPLRILVAVKSWKQDQQAPLDFFFFFFKIFFFKKLIANESL